ncbi:MAG: helix-turn-helix transcriptional regulator, partial [Opitutaceae bacterium]
ACVHEHPVIKFGDLPSFAARAISDFLPQREFRRTTMFNEYYRHVGVQYQIYFNFDGGSGNRRIVAVNRKHRDFSDRDRSVLNLLSPHFGQAYANAVRFEQLNSSLRTPPAAEENGPASRPIAALTPRENEVLGWLVRGKSNPEIATLLGLSVCTVYKHVENIFAKLGVETRAQAMVLALEAQK